VKKKTARKQGSRPKVSQRKRARTIRRITPKPPSSPVAALREKQPWPSAPTYPETISRQEEAVLKDLPFSYGETKLVLLVRDPYWAYSYWDFSGETWNWSQRKLSEDSSLKPMIRLHDLDRKRSYHLVISLEAKNWYLHLGTPDHRYVAELGVGDGKSRFYLMVRSNEVQTPRDSPSHVIDPEWSDRDFEEIYRLSGGGQRGLSSPGSLFFPRQVEG